MSTDNMRFDHDLSAAMQVMDLLAGKWVSSAISAAAKLGVADALARGPKTNDDLAALLRVDAGALCRLLRVLVGVGIFVEDDEGRFISTPLGAALESARPASIHGMAVLMGAEEELRAWIEFPYSLQTGKSAFEKANGAHKYDYMTRHPAYAATFNTAMTSFSALGTGAVLEAYDFAAFKTIVDVAGGRGHLLAALLGAAPGTRGVLLERPEVMEEARQYLQSTGVADRCQLVPGDFFQSVPSGGDAYVLKHIIHNWSDEDAIAILRRCRAAMHDQARLLVLEMVILPGTDLSLGKLLDLEMLVMTPGGRQRTEDEYRRLYAAAGFELTRIVPTRTPLCLIEGARLGGNHDQDRPPR